ncbi:50S ribosomal protein L31e [Candidatus Woesearchaeota archaeon]|nr:50S ribosomal protein L31e [Candidatus Woesearchaeota archaeon]
MERSYNIPLRKRYRYTAKHKKTPKAVRAVREFLAKHMKTELDKIKLGMHLNEHLWKHGIKKPPHHIKVHAIKEEDFVKAELEGFEFKEAVRTEAKKKEPETMKDKLAAKLGVKEGAKKEEPDKEEKKGGKKEEKEEKKIEEKKEEEKEEIKKEETKKPEPKKEKNS